MGFDDQKGMDIAYAEAVKGMCISPSTPDFI